MIQNLTYFAEAAAHEGGSESLFTALGINWQMLIFQMLAFIVLVLLLGKFVFPVLIKAVDDRQAKIEESVKAAADAEKKAEAAESAVEDALKQARKEAADVVATAKTEAIQMVEKAEKSAKVRAERIVAEAHEDIQKEVASVKKSLEKDTLRLVRDAASLATAGVADAKFDAALVKKSIEGAKR
jgi:F-type H+-transporting ATPase subunit b